MADTDENLDPAWLTKLAGDLKELERTDPKVAEAKRKYDQVAKKVLQLPLPPDLLGIDGFVQLSEAPEVFRAMLLDCIEVQNLRVALLDGAVTEADVARWVALRLQDFKQGESFVHETSFCALVVALENVPTPSAQAFIANMAASQAAELPLLPKVAAESSKARVEAKLDPPPVEMQLVGQGVCQCGIPYIVIRQDGKDSTRHKEPGCEFFNRTGRVSLNRDERRALEARKK